jgi:signal peptidase I/rubredoxin
MAALPKSDPVTVLDSAPRSPASLQPETPAIPAKKKSRGSMRGLIDAGLCLYIAVILFRTFEIEGYIISTGSMAPHLLGFHKRVVCPTCGYEFAHGIPVDETGTTADTTEEVSRDGPGQVRCPNCGEDRIDIRTVPPNHGDQLLVQKNVYEFRKPRRWEVVVLKSPSRPTPFVKRVVGLPHESVQIRSGDIYVDGAISRKDLDLQRAMRILVNDNDFLPNDPPDGQGCWTIEDKNGGWSATQQGHNFAFAPPAGGQGADNRAPAASPSESLGRAAAQNRTVWIAFRRWVRHGGRFHTSVPIADAKPVVHLKVSLFPEVRYDQANRRLEATGAIDRAERDRLLALNTQPATRAAIEELAAASHVAAVTDDYGYNRASAGLISLPVRDLFLDCRVALGSDDGDAVFEIGDGRLTFQLVLNRRRGDAELDLVGQREPLRHARCPAGALDQPFQLEFSTFDRQVLAAVNGVLLFAPWECPTDEAEPSRVPVRIGARGLGVEVSRLSVYRDIYYTRGGGRNASDQPIQLGADEYFVLGDNSPVSNDGRSWVQGAIKQSQLLGKPFVVHLPSRPGRISIGGYTRYIRVPDFSRIRYIR